MQKSFHSSGKGKPREPTIQCGRRTGWTGCSILRLLREKLLNYYRSLMIVDHCYSILLALVASIFWSGDSCPGKGVEPHGPDFALQVPLPWICCRSECRSFLLLLKVCARQISCTTQNVQIRGTFDNLAWARVLFSRNFQIFPAFCAWSLQPVSIERLCLEVKVLPALKAKGYPWHETVDHVTYVYFWYLLII